ncbi:hypothetical protein FD44_GL001756 [Secundilactobacillus malefermentans DSM 5705 = KCTC 3548]|nr:hypothetical protein FD44_GL001756 [Secundilactobacillus malefermentans DSM 5705 = KCTC 3548]
MTDENGQSKHSFSNVVETPKEDQIANFGLILEKLTGKKFDSAVITTADNVMTTPAI